MPKFATRESVASRRKQARTRATRRPSARPVSERELLLEIGVRVRAARRAAALTQEGAASRAGIDYKRWQRIEQGQVNATARTLLRVAEAVNTDFWRLLGSEGRKRKKNS